MDNGDYPSNAEEARRGDRWSQHPGGRDEFAPPHAHRSGDLLRDVHATTTRCRRNALHQRTANNCSVHVAVVDADECPAERVPIGPA
ncbi:hypothetical protein, partial [Rhodococcus rhodochrous]|uniref:hypothetical protein n=1 Tax=Rhodococcus rhodochrous TaxID=1829 RepID=UPI0032DF2E0B